MGFCSFGFEVGGWGRKLWGAWGSRTDSTSFSMQPDLCLSSDRKTEAAASMLQPSYQPIKWCSSICCHNKNYTRPNFLQARSEAARHAPCCVAITAGGAQVEEDEEVFIPDLLQPLLLPQWWPRCCYDDYTTHELIYVRLTHTSM